MTELAIWVSIIGGILAILMHIIVSVWWASKITTTLEILLKNFNDSEKEKSQYVRKDDLAREIKTADDVHKELARRIEVLESKV